MYIVNCHLSGGSDPRRRFGQVEQALDQVPPAFLLAALMASAASHAHVAFCMQTRSILFGCCFRRFVALLPGRSQTPFAALPGAGHSSTLHLRLLTGASWHAGPQVCKQAGQITRDAIKRRSQVAWLATGCETATAALPPLLGCLQGSWMCCCSDVPVIVCGDFNSEAREPGSSETAWRVRGSSVHHPLCLLF